MPVRQKDDPDNQGHSDDYGDKQQGSLSHVEYLFLDVQSAIASKRDSFPGREYMRQPTVSPSPDTSVATVKEKLGESGRGAKKEGVQTSEAAPMQRTFLFPSPLIRYWYVQRTSCQ
jgi:hypothetical protein